MSIKEDLNNLSLPQLFILSKDLLKIQYMGYNKGALIDSIINDSNPDELEEATKKIIKNKEKINNRIRRMQKFEYYDLVDIILPYHNVDYSYSKNELILNIFERVPFTDIKAKMEHIENRGKTIKLKGEEEKESKKQSLISKLKNSNIPDKDINNLKDLIENEIITTFVDLNNKISELKPQNEENKEDKIKQKLIHYLKQQTTNENIIKKVTALINKRTVNTKVQVDFKIKSLQKEYDDEEKLENEFLEKEQLANKHRENDESVNYTLDLERYDDFILYDILEKYKSAPNKEFSEYNKKELINEILEEVSFEDLENNLIAPIVKSNFVFKEPRLYQLETITKIYDAIENGYKYIILEAPSGFGKSVIAATLARIYSDEQTYILTPTNQLTTQYINDFYNEDESFIKLNSRSNTKCKNGHKNCTWNNCDKYNCSYFQTADCVDDYYSPDCCNYIIQMDKAITAGTVVCNYTYFIKETFYQSDDFRPRKLLICDEGHNVDSEIVKGTTLTFYESKYSNLRRIGLNLDEEKENLMEFDDYCHTFLNRVKYGYENLLENMNPNSKPYERAYWELQYLNKFCSYFEKYDINLIFEYDDSGDNIYPHWNFKPLRVNKMVNDALTKYGDVCIFMSSSIFDHEDFAYELGIGEDEIFSVRVPNTFDLSKNPVKIYDDFNMGAEHIEDDKYETLPIIEEIINKHPNEKGIIHAHSFECVDFLYRNLNNHRLIRHTRKHNREELVDYFKNSETDVLISPSMNEGVDFPGEECRFQIILKLPYLAVTEYNDKRKSTYENGDKWYLNKMITKLIQTYGRGIRYENDYCKTYILDNRLWEVIEKDLEEYHIIPEYFLKTIDRINLEYYE